MCFSQITPITHHFWVPELVFNPWVYSQTPRHVSQSHSFLTVNACFHPLLTILDLLLTFSTHFKCPHLFSISVNPTHRFSIAIMRFIESPSTVRRSWVLSPWTCSWAPAPVFQSCAFLTYFFLAKVTFFFCFFSTHISPECQGPCSSTAGLQNCLVDHFFNFYFRSTAYMIYNK